MRRVVNVGVLSRNTGGFKEEEVLFAGVPIAKANKLIILWVAWGKFEKICTNGI